MSSLLTLLILYLSIRRPTKTVCGDLIMKTDWRWMGGTDLLDHKTVTATRAPRSLDISLAASNFKVGQI